MQTNAVLTEYRIKSNKLNQPLKIGLITDLHERSPGVFLAMLRKAKPDLIAVAGDLLERTTGENLTERRKTNPIRIAVYTTAYYIDQAIRIITRSKNFAEPENSYRFLREASLIAPVFMSLGNHEEQLTAEDYRLIAENNITLLDNKDTKVCINNNELLIGGLSTIRDDEWFESFSEKQGMKILLSHHPEYYDEFISKKDIDLVLSGHNHGGQMRLFGRGVLSSSSGLFPKYDHGLYDNRLVVSAGCSNTTAIPRINNPKELVIINLSPK